MFRCDARRLVSTRGCWPCTSLHASFCTACTLLVCAKPTRQHESARSACFVFLACCFFLFPLCDSESTPTKSRKGPRPSPKRAPDQVLKGPSTKSRKGPRPCESTPDSDLNEAKLCQIRPSVLLVFLNSQCRASFRPLSLQHAMPYRCQQKSLTFR